MSHFNSTVLTLTHAVLIKRLDGTKIGLTSLNHDFAIDGVSYQANSAIDPTAVSQKTNLSTDNIEIKSLIENNSISPEDLQAGLYENAEVTCALVDFVNLPALITSGLVLLTGYVGQVETQENFFTFEIRSRSEVLNRALNHKTSPVCPYVFGDSDCAKDLVGSGLQVNITILTAIGNQLTVNSSLSTDFIRGTIKLTSGASANKVYEIAAISANIITLTTTPSIIIEPNTTAIATAFCAKTITACNAYNNIINSGAFKVGGNWIPGLSRITVVN